MVVRQVCVVVLPPETCRLWQVRVTCLLWLRHDRLQFPPLLLVSPLLVVVVSALCVCAVIKKKHKVERPANNPLKNKRWPWAFVCKRTA